MTLGVGDRAEVLVTGYGVPVGSVGTVRHVYKNGNVGLRVTHGPGCKPREVPKWIPSVDPADLTPSSCTE